MYQNSSFMGRGSNFLRFDRSSEARCLRRSDLINTLYNALPPNMIEFGHQIVSVKLDPQTTYPVLQLQDGSSVVAKVYPIHLLLFF